MKSHRLAPSATALGVLAAVWSLAASIQSLAASSAPEVQFQHIVISAAAGQARFVEMWNVNHTGRRSVDFEVELPAGATEFELRGNVNAAPQRAARGIRVPGWVKPGENTLAFSYALPLEDGEATWSRSVRYPVRDVVVLIEEGTLALQGGALQAKGPVEFGGRRFTVFAAQGLEAGGALTFTVQAIRGVRPQGAATPAAESSDQPQSHPEEHVVQTSFHGGNSNVRLWMRVTGRPGHGGLLGVFFLSALAVGPIYAVSRLVAMRRLARQQSGQAFAEQSRLEQQKQQLIRAIAELERRRARGEIEEESYLKSREEHKRRLREIMLRLKAAG